MLHYSLNKIKLAFDAQYKNVILTLLTYFPSGLGFNLKDHWSGLGFENVGIKHICAKYCSIIRYRLYY